MSDFLRYDGLTAGDRVRFKVRDGYSLSGKIGVFREVVLCHGVHTPVFEIEVPVSRINPTGKADVLALRGDYDKEGLEMSNWTIIEKATALHDACWQVGVLTDLRPDDPCFRDSTMHLYLRAQSEAATTTPFGAWYFKDGLEGAVMPALEWIYFDGESFFLDRG